MSKKKVMGLLLALMMVFSLCSNSFTAYAWNLSDIEEMPMEDPNAIDDEPVVDEPEPVEEDFAIEEANEPEVTIEEDDQNEDLGDGLEISDEEVPEPVAVPDGFDLSTINTIAKTLENGQIKYYGVRTYGNTFDTKSGKTFYNLTEEEYNQVADDCFMVFKRQDGGAFEIPGAKIGTNSISDTQPNGTVAGPIFTELQFRHHMAYREGFISSNDPTRLDSQKDLNWYMELKKDWIIEPYAGFGDNNGSDDAYTHFNLDLEGNGFTLKRNDANDQCIFQIGPNNSGATGSNTIVTIKNLNIVGYDNHFGILLRDTTTLNLVNTHISNCNTSLSSRGGGITLLDGTVLNMDANSSITGCKANFGGAIYSGDKATVNISGELSNNQADLGGAICSLNENSNININGATFDGNKAVKTIDGEYLNGGAIYSQSNLSVEDSKFINNSADGNGGAIYSYKAYTINGSKFNKNSSKKSGGAVYAPAKTDIKDTKFTKNEAKWGGAIFNTKKLSINNVAFDGNTATLYGGAIYTNDKKYENTVDASIDYQNLTIDDKTTFTNNKAKGYFNPPENVKDLTNIKFKRTTFTGTKKINPDSPLNNYDINYKRDIVVTYDPNDGNEAVEDKQTGQEVKGYEIKTVKDLKFTNTSKFLGWSEDKDSKNPEYKAGDKVDLTGNLYIYAIWEKPAPKPSEPSTVILTLDENYRGGEITNIEVEEGDLIEPHLYIPRRRGYIFKGWSYDRKHLDEVKPGDRIYSDTTLYAIWKRAEEEKVEEPEEIKGEDHKAYIFGYPNGTVRPNGSITRAEAAAMLARLLNIEAIGSAAKPQFTDTESSWYNKAINAVVFRGIMKGYPDGRFRPNAPITRAEFTQMISTIDNKPYGVAPFADVPGHWAERAIGSEYQAKRITGYPDGLFRPGANITRAEAAVILNKIFERKYDNLSLLKCKNPQMIKRFTDLDETFWGWNDMVEATNTHEYVRRYKEDLMKRVEEDWLLIKDIKDVK